MRLVYLKIARKEFIEVARDGRFRWAFGAIFTLLAASLLMGWRHYAEVNRQIEAARAEQRELWLNTPDRNPHSAAHHGLYIFKPVMPLSAVDNGIDSYSGVSFLLDAHDQNLSQHKPVEDTTAIQRFSETTTATTLQILIPLLIVLLTFPSFAGEREQGTLRQLLSLGVRRRDLAFGKGLGAAGPILLLLIPATVIGVLAMRLATTTECTPRGWEMSWARLSAMVLGYLVYFTIFAGVSLMVSARAATARMALVTLLALWFINCLVAPRVMADAARHAVRLPATSEFLQRIDEDKKQVPPDWQERITAQLMAQYGVRKVEDLPVDPLGAHLIEGDKIDSAIYEKNFNQLFSAYERQERIYQAGGAFAPMLAMQTLSTGLAGTDLNQHRHFTHAVGEYRKQWLKVLNEDLFFNRRPGQMVYTRGRDLWEQVPEMKYDPPGLVWVLSRYQLSIGLLAGWGLLVVIATPLALAKVKVD
jgi:ABC-2 type transport system permease protein